jgi:ABC-type transport system involved in multi-copper enzyme maturation permease subunit
MRQTFAIARYTALEAIRTRASLFAAVMLALLLAASYFVREIAITDSLRLQTTFLAAALRFACIFIASAFIIGAVAREFNDKGQLLLLSLALTRVQYVLGKFFGFVAVVVVLCLLAGLVVSVVSRGTQTLYWSCALALEAAIMTAISLFCALSLRQIAPAATVVVGFYLLSRSIASIQLMAHSSVVSGTHAAATLVDALALLLPRMDLFAGSARLVEPVSWSGLLALATQAALYCGVALVAASLDLHRKDL